MNSYFALMKWMLLLQCEHRRFIYFLMMGLDWVHIWRCCFRFHAILYGLVDEASGKREVARVSEQKKRKQNKGKNKSGLPQVICLLVLSWTSRETGGFIITGVVGVARAWVVAVVRR